MRSTLRALGLAAALFTGSFAIAQNVVTITGTVSPCMGVIYPVHIVTNSVPPIDTTVYTGANCQYSFTFFPVETQGTFVVETSCDGGATWSSATGSWNPFFPQVVVDLSCTGGPCLLDAFGSLFCATPWQVVFSGGAGNGTPPYSYNWSFWNGSTSMQPIETVTLLAPGTFTACLLVTDANGCTASGSSTINQPVVLSASVIGTNVSCFEETMALQTLVHPEVIRATHIYGIILPLQKI